MDYLKIKRLASTPIVEALFEVRFSPIDIKVGEMLPGLLYSKLREIFPSVAALPMANAPLEFREGNEQLRYQATQKLFSATQSIQVGPRVVAVSVQKYETWDSFRSLIKKVLAELDSLAVISSIERHSFKYVNLIKHSDDCASVLDDFNIDVSFMGNTLQNNGFQLRFEQIVDGYVNVFHLISGANVKGLHIDAAGTLVNLDTIDSAGRTDLFHAMDECLENGHNQIKKAFFNLLAEPTIQNLKPEYFV